MPDWDLNQVENRSQGKEQESRKVEGGEWKEIEMKKAVV